MNSQWTVAVSVLSAALPKIESPSPPFAGARTLQTVTTIGAYPQDYINQAYGTKLFKVEILLIRIAYCTKRITFLLFLFFFGPSFQSKEATINPSYSLGSSVAVFVVWLLFDLSIHNASFYIIPNDDQWNACAVSWINKPSYMLDHGISFSQTLLRAVTRCCSAMLYNTRSSERGEIDSLVCSTMDLGPPHPNGETDYCASISLFCKIGKQTRNRLTECNL